MTSDATKKDELEKPFSTKERIRMILFLLFVYPIMLGFVLLPGAYIRSYPQAPDLWYGFWVTIFGIPCCAVASLPCLFDCPRVMRRRMTKFAASKEESIPEQRFHKLVTLIFFGSLLFASYDASGVAKNLPRMWNWIGFTSMAASLVWIVWVLRTNKYASRVVHVQPGQKLVKVGPYAVVRHPMYMACVPTFCGFPLCLGSVWGVLPMSLCAVLIAIRTFDEEKFLVQTFGKDYEDYRREVPYKMLPFIF